MITPAYLSNQRQPAGFAAPVGAPLADVVFGLTVDDTKCGSPVGSPFVHLDHTPSPQGQQAAQAVLLPSFFRDPAGGRRAIPSAPGAAHHACSQVSVAGKSRQGTARCPSRNSRLRPCYARALRPAATRWPNKALAVPPSAQVLPRSPAAAFCKGRPSVRRAISPIASSTPANVANFPSAARLTRCTRSNDPAQPSLPRGFRVYTKTKEDTSCSRKS